MAALGASILVAAFVVASVYFLLKWLRIKRIIDKIPGPRSFPIVGNVLQLKRDPDDFFEQVSGISMMYQKPRMLRIWIMWLPYVLVHGPEEAEPILTKHINKGRLYKLMHPWLGLGLLTSAAEKWRPRRKLLTPTFHYDILKDFVDVFNQQGKILVSKLEERAGVEKSFDIFLNITLCALDIICETAMGQNVNAQSNKNSDYVTAIYKINDIIHERQKKPWLWLNIVFNAIGRGKEHQWCLDVIHGFTQKVIDKRYEELKRSGGVGNLLNNNVAGGKRRLAFLDLLLDLVEQNKMPMEDVRNEVDTFMFEGHDTTSAGMNWLIHLLGCSPEIQLKAQQEVDAVFGDGEKDLGYEDLKNLPYLECCIKEALRLFPSVPLFARTLKEDAVVAGYTIPSGTEVIVNPYSVHRDPKHWPEPEIFDPDRFLPENAIGRHPYAYLSFSAGSRNCIGQRFALMEEKTVMAWIIRYFTIRSVHRRDQVRPKAELILRPCQGVHVHLEPRQLSGPKLTDRPPGPIQE